MSETVNIPDWIATGEIVHGEQNLSRVWRREPLNGEVEAIGKTKTVLHAQPAVFQGFHKPESVEISRSCRFLHTELWEQWTASRLPGGFHEAPVPR